VCVASLVGLSILAPVSGCGSVDSSADGGGSGGTMGVAGAAGTTGMAGIAGTGGAGACPPGQSWCWACPPAPAGTGFCNATPCILLCPDPNPSCDRLATQAVCEARTDCHAVFVDPMNCPCDAIGCCARFSACAAGGTARCNSPQTLCRAAAPYCESPVYVVAYTESCYEGCVRPEVCAP
jgi:hypothetical protein